MEGLKEWGYGRSEGKRIGKVLRSIGKVLRRIGKEDKFRRPSNLISSGQS